MKSSALKLELLEWLAKTDDESILASLKLLKRNSEHIDWADDLTPSQLKQINQGLDDIKNGRVISSKKLWQKYGRKA